MENNTTSAPTTTDEPVEVTTTSAPTTTDEPVEVPTTSAPTTTDEPAEVTTENNVKLTDVNVSDKNVALNVMVGALNIAQRRGVFQMDESAKVWEAIKFFIVSPGDGSGSPAEVRT